MTPATELELLQRLARLERRERSSRRWAAAALALAALSATAALSAHAPAAMAAAPPPRFLLLDSLRVRALVVVDAAGRERARVAAPLPDPIILGKRIPRGGAISGFLISDAEGNERGGYVTSDGYPNAFFTLDDMGAQNVLFLAEPQGATTLMIRKGGHSFVASVSESGPTLRLEKDRGVVFREPADTTRR